MNFIADLHIHSRFSRATSRNLDPENLAVWAGKKGLSVIGTGDFTHPGWLSELQEKLVEAESGLYRLKEEIQRSVEARIPSSCSGPVRFLLSGEISCIYKKNGKTRKLHHLVLMPAFSSVLKLNEHLARVGNIFSDGRPILGLDSKDLLEMVFEVDERAFFIPAHIWTPWFSVFGSKSGFDSLEDCFEDLTDHIYALETGLSSDPPMNRLLSALDDYLLVSNSDAHSPAKLGREANLFDTEMDYDHMIKAMKDGQGFLGTTEFFPEEGKYHLDGHRKCATCLHPAQTEELDGMCPECNRPLTVGVLHRVHDLADRNTPKLQRPFISLIPLNEVLAEIFGCGPSTKKVSFAYEDLISELGPELRILMDVPLEELEKSGVPLLREALSRMRRNEVKRREGFDGQYGTIHLFDPEEMQALSGQTAIFQNRRQTGQKHPHGIRETGTPHRKTKRPASAERPSFEDPILGPLNPEQKRAVTLEEGNLLVTAGPGTGKTMTLTHRIAYLIRESKASPEEILGLTFTRKAAGEMKQRVEALINSGKDGHKDPGEGCTGSFPLISTFHSLCLEILRAENDKTGLPEHFSLCSESDAEGIARDCIQKENKGTRMLSGFLKALPVLKAESVLPSAFDYGKDLVGIFHIYQERLRELGMLDLEDLEVEALRLFKESPETSRNWASRYPWIFIDEYQDTSRIQAELLKSLTLPKALGNNSTHRGGIFAIGDPDQAIYAFRGADMGNFLRFEQEFPAAQKITLTRNYRSTQAILRGAAGLLKKKEPLQHHISGNEPVSLACCKTAAQEGEMIVEQIERLLGGTSYFSLDSGRVSSHEGDKRLTFGDMAVLFRLNAQGEEIEKAFQRSGIPYFRSGEIPLVKRYPVNVIWRYLQTLRHPDNDYYLETYKSLLKGLDIKPALSETTLPSLSAPSELIDRALSSHNLDCSGRDAQEALSRLLSLSEDFKGHPEAFLDFLSLERGIDHGSLTGDRVPLMSLHAAKGLEWPVVFITGCEYQLIPFTLFGKRSDPEEERRLFYVGITRACSRLILSHVNRRSFNGKAREMLPSPFLKDLPPDIVQPLDRAWKPEKRPHRQLELF